MLYHPQPDNTTLQASLDRVELLGNRHAGVYGDGARTWLSLWRCKVHP